MSAARPYLHRAPSTHASAPPPRTPPTDGRREKVAFDKITSRINKLCYGLDMNYVDPAAIAQKVRVSFLFPACTDSAPAPPLAPAAAALAL